MDTKRIFRVAVLGTPLAEKWLLVPAFAATRRRDCAYELIADPVRERPDIMVVDAEEPQAVARWAALDPTGALPTAFFVRVHPRAKCALIVPRPITSARVIDSLDQMARRFLGVSFASTVRPVADARGIVAAAGA